MTDFRKEEPLPQQEKDRVFEESLTKSVDRGDSFDRGESEINGREASEIRKMRLKGKIFPSGR